MEVVIVADIISSTSFFGRAIVGVARRVEIINDTKSYIEERMAYFGDVWYVGIVYNDKKPSRSQIFRNLCTQINTKYQSKNNIYG